MMKEMNLFWIFMLQFLHCNGCSNIYTSIGPCRKPKSSYVLDKFTSITQTECENHCNNNSGCKGFGYSTSSIFGQSSCELSSSSFYEFGFFCSSVFYMRHCPAGCFNSYTVHDQYTQGEGVMRVETQKEKQCEFLCNANSSCQGFRHDTSDDSCELTVGNTAIHSSSSGSHFYQRHCPKDCIDSYSSPIGYSKSKAVYSENNKATEAECQAECNADSFCMGFYYRADMTLCQLSTTQNFHFGGSFNFYRRHCYGQGASFVTKLTSLETTRAEGIQTTLFDTKTGTLQETLSTSTTGLVQTTLSDDETFKTTEDTLNQILTISTSKSTIVNSSLVQCVCLCRNSNMSLEETIEKRKELQVNVDELSSSKRKLISVEDPRPSAQAIGHVGVGILVLVGCLFLLPDLFTGLTFIIRSYKL